MKGKHKKVRGSDRITLYLDRDCDMTLCISQNAKLNTKQVNYSQCKFKFMNNFKKFISLLISSLSHIPSLSQHPYF